MSFTETLRGNGKAEEAPLVTLEPNARVMKPYPVEEISIVGMGLSALQLQQDVYTMQVVPEKGKREIWTVNAGGILYRAHLCFNMRDFTEQPLAGPAHSNFDLYKDIPMPLVTTRYVKELPMCHEYPWQQVVDTFGDYYFTTSSAYLIAFAMLCIQEAREQRPDKNIRGTIRIYGMDYNYPGKDQYEAGRACLEYWIGRAKQFGCEILLPQITTLMDTHTLARGQGPNRNGILYGLHSTRPEFSVKDGKVTLKRFVQVANEPTPKGSPPPGLTEGAQEKTIKETKTCNGTITGVGEDSEPGPTQVTRDEPNDNFVRANI